MAGNQDHAAVGYAADNDTAAITAEHRHPDRFGANPTRRIGPIGPIDPGGALFPGL